MLTILHDIDRSEREAILSSDPFQLSTPCWKVRVLPSLPVETSPTVTAEQIRDKEKRLMAIRTVEVKDAPVRLKGSKMNSNADYNAVMEALRNPANKDKAIVVSLEDPSWESKPKPEIAFAYTLRRFFAVQKINYTAYQSGPKEVTVRAMSALEKTGATHKSKK